MRALFDLHGLDAVFYKEIRHVARDPATLVLAIAMPLMQLLLFGYAINLKVENIRSAYYSEDRGRLAEQVIDGLKASRGFDIAS